MRYEMFSSVHGLYPLDANSTSPSVITIKMSPDITKSAGEQNQPQLKTTELEVLLTRWHTTRLLAEDLSSLLAINKKSLVPFHMDFFVRLLYYLYDMATIFPQSEWSN